MAEKKKDACGCGCRPPAKKGAGTAKQKGNKPNK